MVGDIRVYGGVYWCLYMLWGLIGCTCFACARRWGVPFSFTRRRTGMMRVGIININNNNKGTMGHVISTNIGNIRFITVGASGTTLLGSGTGVGLRVNSGAATKVNTNNGPGGNRTTTRRSHSRVTTIVHSTSVVFVATNVNNNANANTTPIITTVTGRLNVLAINVIAGPFTFRNGGHVARTRSNVTTLHRGISDLIMVPGRHLGFMSARGVAFGGTFSVTSSILHRNIRDVSRLVGIATLIGLSFTSIGSVVTSTNCTRVNINITANHSGTRRTTHTTVDDPLVRASVSGTHNIVVDVANSISVNLRRIRLTSAVVSRVTRPSTAVV